MADAVHEAVTEADAERRTACGPHAQAEVVEGICDHLTGVEMRSAGATAIIQGEVNTA